MAEWLKGCEICDAALIKCVDEFVSCGMSENAACKETHKQQYSVLGTELYSVATIRNRYQYHKGTKKVAQNEQGKTDIEKLFGLIAKVQKQTNKVVELPEYQQNREKLKEAVNDVLLTLMERK